MISSEDAVTWELNDIREPGDGRKTGYVRTESESTRNERELLVLIVLMLFVLALELARDDSFDFFGLPATFSSTGADNGRGWSLCRFMNSGGMTGSVGNVLFEALGVGEADEVRVPGDGVAS